MRRLDLRMYENIIEISWMFDDLMKKEKIKSWDILVDELSMGSDAIKELIMQIAEDFEKEYDIYDWNEVDMDYISEIGKYARKRLLKEYGKEKSIIKVGDTVKVISDTVSHWNPEERTEYIPIGTICVVRNVDYNKDGSVFCEIEPIGSNYTFCYMENELEKGRMEWVRHE